MGATASKQKLRGEKKKTKQKKQQNFIGEVRNGTLAVKL